MTRVTVVFYRCMVEAACPNWSHGAPALPLPIYVLHWYNPLFSDSTAGRL